MRRLIACGAVAALMLVTVFSPFAPAKASESESESTSPITFSGQLIELSSTTAPTTIIVRKDPAGEFVDYTVDIDTSTRFGTNAINTTSMDDWITGDGMNVVGTLNNNTGVVTATTVVNASLNPQSMRGLNGWISSIGTNSLSVQWNGVEHNVNVISTTHMVVGSTNPAAITDFEVGDRLRIRLDRGTENARIIVVLRRGDEIFLKARTRGFWAEVTDIDESDDSSGKIDATLLANPHLRSGDVNNMVGEEGDSIDINYDEDTKFVRKFMGSSEISEFQIGDRLFVVGRVSDEGTIDARLIKDDSMWMKGVSTHVGVVESIDTASNVFTVSALDGSASSADVSVYYTSDTEFKQSGAEKTEGDLFVGAEVRVRGIAHTGSGTLTIEEVDTVIIIPVGPHSDDSDDESDEDADTEDEDADDEESDDESSDDEDSADLVVSDISLSSSNLITATLANEGDADVTVPVSIYFYLNGELSWTYSSSTLADQDFLDDGESSTITPQGITETTVVKVCVDPLNVVSESDEDNNCLEETMTVSA